MLEHNVTHMLNPPLWLSVQLAKLPTTFFMFLRVPLTHLDRWLAFFIFCHGITDASRLLGIYLGRRGRENQRDMKPAMLALRATPQGEEYFELNREFPGSLPATKNHQGGLSDAEDESDAKIFSVPESAKCPVKTIKNYLSHLNPKLDCLFQRPREKARSFNLDEDKVWYCTSPLGVNILDSILKLMSSGAGI